MSISNDYPKLANFLGSWFPDSDLEGLSDEEIVNDFVKKSRRKYVYDVLAEFESLLRLETIPHDDIGKEANLYFDGEEDCLKWIKEIELYLKESLDAK